MVNVSDEILAIEALHTSHELRRLTEALPLGVLQIDATGRIIYRNERLLAILGDDPGETIEELLTRFLPADHELLANAFRDLGAGRDGDLEVRLSQGGEARRCSLSLRELRSDTGNPTGAIVCITDITESVRMREELQVRANHDMLTGCHNRESILALLDRTIHEPSVLKAGVAVLFVDLDRFKRINDSWGHAVGDQCLRLASERLAASTRGNDFIGRIGGDEFLIVCQYVSNPEQALAVAERVAAALREAFEIDAIRIEPQASIGAVWTNGAINADALIAAADEAMYDSKRAGLGLPVLVNAEYLASSS